MSRGGSVRRPARNGRVILEADFDAATGSRFSLARTGSKKGHHAQAKKPAPARVRAPSVTRPKVVRNFLKRVCKRQTEEGVEAVRGLVA